MTFVDKLHTLTILTGHLDWQPHVCRPRDQRLHHGPLKYSRLEVVEVHWRQRKPRHPERQLQASGTGRLWNIRLQTCELDTGVEEVLELKLIVSTFRTRVKID
jgi:hypothetical protein